MISFLRKLVEMDFEQQVKNTKYCRILLVLVTIGSYLIARQQGDIMICVRSILVASAVSVLLFAFPMPWSRSKEEYGQLAEKVSGEQEEQQEGEITETALNL